MDKAACTSGVGSIQNPDRLGASTGQRATMQQHTAIAGRRVLIVTGEPRVAVELSGRLRA
jgi:hypothetical protein